MVFSIVLGIAARHRRLDELSVPRVAAWGALAGMMVGTLPFLIGEPGASNVWLLAAVVIGTITTLSAASAAGSLALAQRAERGALPRAGGNSPLVGAGLPDMQRSEAEQASTAQPPENARHR